MCNTHTHVSGIKPPLIPLSKEESWIAYEVVTTFVWWVNDEVVKGKGGLINPLRRYLHPPLSYTWLSFSSYSSSIETELSLQRSLDISLTYATSSYWSTSFKSINRISFNVSQSEHVSTDHDNSFPILHTLFNLVLSHLGSSPSIHLHTAYTQEGGTKQKSELTRQQPVASRLRYPIKV